MRAKPETVAFSEIFEESVQLLLPRVDSLDAQSVANAARFQAEEALKRQFCFIFHHFELF